MKKLVAIILTFVITLSLIVPTVADSADFISDNEGPSLSTGGEAVKLDIDAKSAYLIEAETGTVLYANNELADASPASVTKIMTLLLVMEAIDEGIIKLTDVVSVSPYAASFGGSQVFLEEGERISVEDLLKSTVIASANDAAVALAELVCGSESAFVSRMNQKAMELGLKNTHFQNTTGLDDTTTDHYSCALDIATMSRELIKHELILKYSSIWQDTIRDGQFTLTNTNRLVRYYDGCNGLKTGSTDKAGYCVSTTAKRDNMQLIAVIMGAETRDGRNAAARTLLDFGFSNYALYEESEQFLEDASVVKGKKDAVGLYTTPFRYVVKKGEVGAVEKIYEIPEKLVAPFSEGEAVGKVTYKLADKVIGHSDICTEEAVMEIGIFEIFVRILKNIFLGGKS